MYVSMKFCVENTSNSFVLASKQHSISIFSITF